MSSANAIRGWGFASALMLAASCASHPIEPMGGETHWLRECREAAECGDEGLQCICGVCTRSCAGDAACAGAVPAACYDQGSPLLLQRCDSGESGHSAGVCLPDCTKDEQCGSARACVQGACVPALSPARDAGLTDASGVSSSLDIDDFADVQPEIAWTEPVDRPALSTTIAGGDPRIAGVWKETNCDRNESGGEGCIRFELAVDGAGVMTGTLYRDDGAPEKPLPVVDPDVGYPPEFPLDDLRNYGWFLQSGFPYRLLDGHFEDGTLTFVWSHFDLWREWCAAQTPQRWLFGDHAFYFCAPQDREAQAELDEAKVVLCTSASFGTVCTDEANFPTPCDCLGETTSRCGVSVCTCDSEHCEAELRLAGVQASLVVEGDTMQGFLGGWPTENASLSQMRYTFARVTP